MKRFHKILYRFAALSIIAMSLVTACATVTPTPLPTATVTNIPTVEPSETPTRTPFPTRTPTATPTQTPTPTPTPVPVGLGQAVPMPAEKIIEANLGRLQLLGQWGRGRSNGIAWARSGGYLAVGTPLGVYLYDGPSLPAPRFLQTGAPAGVLTFSPDGRFLAVDLTPPGTGADLPVIGAALPPNHRIQVWDLDANPPAPVMELGSANQTLYLVFHEKELFALSRVKDGAQLQVWPLDGTGFVANPKKRINLTGGGEVYEGVLAPDLSIAATRAESGPVFFWRLTDGANLGQTPGENVRAPGAMAFSPDGQLLAVAYPDRTIDYKNENLIRVWSIPTGDKQPEIRFSLVPAGGTEGAKQSLVSMAWSPDGMLLAGGTEDGQLNIWKAQSGPVFRVINTGVMPVPLAWSPASDAVAVGGLEVWQIAQPSKANVLLGQDAGFLAIPKDLRLSPDGSLLALAGIGRIDLRSTTDGTLLRSITGMDGPVNGVAFNREGTLLAAACDDGTARLYLVKDGRYLAQLGAPTFAQRAVTFSSNGWWVASSGDDMRIRVFKVDDGKLFKEIEEPFTAYQLLFDPNSLQLASLTTNGVNVRSLSGTTLKVVKLTLIGSSGGVGLTDMAYSPGAESLALTGSGIIHVVDPATIRDRYTLFDESGALPWSATFTPDNAFLVTGWSDGSIRFYWAADGTLMHTIPNAHPEPVRRVMVTSDGRFLISLGAEGTVRIWGIGQ
jgi:WD40 repeat protein